MNAVDSHIYELFYAIRYTDSAYFYEVLKYTRQIINTRSLAVYLKILSLLD